jgi:hypothetical protein
VLGEEVDVAGLKRAIEAPRPLEVPLSEGLVEEDSGQGELPLEMPAEAAAGEESPSDGEEPGTPGDDEGQT